MKVFKFGGASVNSIERIKNVADILQSYKSEKILIVISAMGKTTNALEKVAEAFFANEMEASLQLFSHIKNDHLQTAKDLLHTGYEHTCEQLSAFFTEVEWLLHDRPVRDYDYYYDQIVCVGELLSTAIVCAYFNERGLNACWIDVRDIFRTDDNFRDANIHWSFTTQRLVDDIVPLFDKHNFVVTQGFIGSTDENESTTLGREGSDYTAAVFANILEASGLTIWKDVEGVMNADPKDFPEAKIISELNYDEVIEMAYYGAQVIHPKTIKPLQNKSIPLYVKCFLNINIDGTVIHNSPLQHLPPIIVIKDQQALMHLHTKDFSFVSGKPMVLLYQLLADLNITPNLVQSGAVHIDLCLDDKSDKIEKLALAASETFNVTVEKNLRLLTIRHPDHEIQNKLLKGKQIELRQESPETVQAVVK